MKELKRYKILQDVISKKLPLTQGARIMGISYRQALRLKKRFLERGVEEKWWLISVVEDATSEVVYARFYRGDTTYGNMEVLKEVIKGKGIFMALYVDRASHFATTRHGGLWNEVKDEQKDTNIEQALKELGITLITAKSAESKGRIERSFKTMQDRLINEMWKAGINNYADANKYLEEKFIDYYNSHFGVEPNDKESRYSNIPRGTDLEMIFTKRVERRVRKDNTISIYKEIIQLPEVPKLNLLKAKVELRISKENKVWILYKDNVIYETYLSGNNEVLNQQNKEEHILWLKEYVPEFKICDTSNSNKS